MTGVELIALDFIQNNLHFEILNAFMVLFTYLGDFGIVWIAIAVAYLVRDGLRGRAERQGREFGREAQTVDRMGFAHSTDVTGRRIGMAIILGIVLSFIIGSLILKNLVARPRPCDIDLSVQLLIARPTDYSFPSGHTAASFAAVAVLFLARSRWRAPAAVLAVLIAYSRLYLFVHYPSDVLAGMLLGILCGWLAWQICGSLERRMPLRGSPHMPDVSRGSPRASDISRASDASDGTRIDCVDVDGDKRKVGR